MWRTKAYEITLFFVYIVDPVSTAGKDACFFIITSTTGNGEPPHHAISFKGALEDAKNDECQNRCLKSLKYAVFALGSSIYPNFCSFGIYCDETIAALGKYLFGLKYIHFLNILTNLFIGGDRITDLVLGDEQKGQDRSFRSWTKNVLLEASKTFDLELSKLAKESWPFEISRTLVRKSTWRPQSFKKASHTDSKHFSMVTFQVFCDTHSLLLGTQTFTFLFHYKR